MKFHYYPETDSLYIDFSEKVSVESVEVAPGIVVDLDAEGHLTGIDIDNASRVINLTQLEVRELPFSNFMITQNKSAAHFPVSKKPTVSS